MDAAGSNVFSPAEIARVGVSFVEDRARGTDPGVPLGVPSLDTEFLPMRAGELCSVLGRPRNGKTGLMLSWARRRADEISETSAVVYVTYEQTVEELFAFIAAAEADVRVDDMARGTLEDAEVDAVRMAAVRSSTRPLWIIGHSAGRKSARPRLTIKDVQEELLYIQNEHGIKIDIVFADYLQRIPAQNNRERRLEVAENVDSCKDLALFVSCPFVLGVQARRDVDDRDFPMPEIQDGQETANIEQASDKIICVSRPSCNVQTGEPFGPFTCKGRNQMLVAVRKQKMGRDNWMREVYYDPAHNIMRDWPDLEEGLGE